MIEFWKAQKEKLKVLVERYGPLVIGIYLSTFAISMVGFYVALGLGFEVEGFAGDGARLATAYGLTKLIQPFRILLTAALTPLVARLIRSPS